ncbi:MAG: hypothetical protein LBR60_09545 [Fibrobacter sp.]|nr:hypothetical protein [Fibrobacter sp.]
MKLAGFLICLFIFTAEAAFRVTGINVDTLPVWNPATLAGVSGSADFQNQERDSLRLHTEGTKAIQVVVGDGGTQVDQELRLSIQGEISPSIYIDAFLSDVGREPGDQRTATLEEVDQIYFRVETPYGFLHLGDLIWTDSSLALSSLSRSSMGVGAALRAGHTEVRGMVGMDKVERISAVFRGVDGQRDGYVLGSSAYLSLVPYSETVWLNGVPLVRERDYLVNYAGGVLDFKGFIIPGSEDEIRVEYEAYQSESVQMLKAADAHYRSRNLWLDLSGFRLETAADRMRRGAWSDDDYKMLQKDSGGVFDRADTLPALARPFRTDRLGARIRLAAASRFFADAEVLYQKKDTNSVSPLVEGPEGKAFRWKLSTDSSLYQKHSVLLFENYGNFIQEGFNTGDFQGTDRDWDSYFLSNDWDLDSASLSGGLRHDHFKTQARLPFRFYPGFDFGYRQSVSDSGWNSSRARLYLDHQGKAAASSLSLVRVASFQEINTERYQVLLNSGFHSGFFRPYGSGSLGIWQRDSSETQVRHSEQVKSTGGFELVDERWSLREEIFGHRIRSGKEKQKAEDSLKVRQWTQGLNYNDGKYLFSHLLQYKLTELDTAGKSNSWITDNQFEWRNFGDAFQGNVFYRLGFTDEQPYVAIYKPVAPGTGDVLYDSLTGEFIEGVDKGDYVYEGMGRNDSLPPIKTSSARISFNTSVTPGPVFGITQGFLRDITLSASAISEGADTSGAKLYLPPHSVSKLRELTSGLFYLSGALEWNLPKPEISFTYELGTESEKKNTNYGYFSTRNFHSVRSDYYGRAKEIWMLHLRQEWVELDALQNFDWNIREGNISWRRELPKDFAVKPAYWIRYGSGEDETETLDALLNQGGLEVSWQHSIGLLLSADFSMTHVKSSSAVLPYQMVSGFGKGTTYRISAGGTVDASDFLSFSLNYVARFGNAESGIFQKLSTEARAYF